MGAPRERLEAIGRFSGRAGDRAHFVARVNGQEIWRRHQPAERRWQAAAIPLREYAGRDVVLSLAVDCGRVGFNTSCDNCYWGEPRTVIGD